MHVDGNIIVYQSSPPVSPPVQSNNCQWPGLHEVAISSAPLKTVKVQIASLYMYVCAFYTGGSYH